MTPVIRSRQAEEDLDGIFDSIAERNEDYAYRVTRRIYDVYLLLSEHPESGPLRPRFGEELRLFPVEYWVIFYRYTEGVVTIERVLDSRSNTDEELKRTIPRSSPDS